MDDRATLEGRADTDGSVFRERGKSGHRGTRMNRDRMGVTWRSAARDVCAGTDVWGDQKTRRLTPSLGVPKFRIRPIRTPVPRR